MRRVLMYFLVVAFLFLIQQPSHTIAAETINTREDVMDFLKNSFYTQVSLTEVPREMEEIKNILKTYFTDDYIELFLSENIVEDNGKYITYGSDFAPYYIPFFQFSERTEVSIEDDSIYIYEYFEEMEDGPVTYQAHYEGILMEKINQEWKISKLLNNQEIETFLEKQQSEMDNLVYSSDVYWMDYIYLLSDSFGNVNINNDTIIDKRQQQTLNISGISPIYY